MVRMCHMFHHYFTGHAIINPIKNKKFRQLKVRQTYATEYSPADELFASKTYVH